MNLSQRSTFATDYFENSIWVKESLVNSWFNIAIAQIHIFILVVGSSISFEGAFPCEYA